MSRSTRQCCVSANKNDGFLRVAAASPQIRVADVEGNAEVALAAVREAAERGVRALVLPELNLCGYTAADLFHNRTLLHACEAALVHILDVTRELPIVFTIGLPVAVAENIYNCAAVCCAGELLGLTAKEVSAQLWRVLRAPLVCSGAQIPCGLNLPVRVRFRWVRGLSTAAVMRVLRTWCWASRSVRTCGYLRRPRPRWRLPVPRLILNPSASDEIIGKADYRRSLISNQSARLYCAYAYADASEGESTTDMVFAGENLVYENGSKLAATKLLTCDMAVADVDLDRLVAERRRSTTWTRADDAPEATTVEFSFEGVLAKEPVLRDALDIDRVFPRAPFVPADHGDLAERCETILDLQTAGLKTRLAHTGTKAAVIGLSGGLDSTLALLVTVRAFDALGLPRTGITAVSMPGFGTTHRTKSNAESLARDLGVSFREVSIHAAVEQHFKDIEHDSAVQDVTYENSQARERTQILMDLANQAGGFVIGTGDLSELALGWATYNGDHMSMYAVNASVPKTLVRHLVRYAADVFGGRIAEVLLDILDTPVSPELLPPTGDGEIAQKTEDLVGPYELHDYFLYYLLRFGFEPGKIYRMALKSFEGVYDAKTVHTWLRTFYRRFFAQQFKRSCLPDGPKVGSVTLSPRGDWRMPSDASSRLWLAQIDALNPVD
mgnify:CR=1 FL=1